MLVNDRKKIETYLFVNPDNDDSVLIQDAEDAADLILPELTPFFSNSPVLFCLRIFNP